MRTFFKNFCLLPLPPRCCYPGRCAWASSGAVRAGASSGVRASLCGGFSGCGARALRVGASAVAGSVAVARGLHKRRHYSCGTRESLLQGAGLFSWTRDGAPVFYLDSGFFCGPPGKPWPLGHAKGMKLVFCRMPLNWGFSEFIY